MSNVKMKMKPGYTFPKREDTTFGAFNYPKIECIKALRGVFGLTLKGAKDLVESVVEHGNSDVDVLEREDNVNRYFDPVSVRAHVNMAYLSQYFEFAIEGEVAGDSKKKYERDVKRLLNSAISVKRFDDARALIGLIEDLSNDR